MVHDCLDISMSRNRRPIARAYKLQLFHIDKHLKVYMDAGTTNWNLNMLALSFITSRTCIKCTNEFYEYGIIED